MRGGQAPVLRMPFYVDDYLNDPWVELACARSDLAASAFYPRFLFRSWREGGRLPSDPERLGAALHMRPEEVRTALDFWAAPDCGLVLVENGSCWNPRVVRDLEKEMAVRQIQSAGGRAGGKLAGKGRPSKRRGSRQGVVRVHPNQPQASSLYQASTDIEAPAEPLAAAPRPPEIEPEAPAVDGSKAQRPARETWLTAYGDAYHERWGAESEPPWGEMARTMKACEAKVGRPESLARWGRFLAAKERPEWCKPSLFHQSLGTWAERLDLAPARPPATGGRTATAADRTTEAVRSVVQREANRRPAEAGAVVVGRRSGG